MANYIGNVPASGEFKRLDSIASSFDGSTTQFNLNYNTVSQSVGDASQLIVSLNGIIQEPLESYTLGIGGSSIIFSSAPASGDACHIVLLGGVGSTITPTDGSVTATKLDAALKDYNEDEFTANGSTTDFTLSRESAGVNSLLVTIDGIVQPTSAYSATGTTLTISPALPNGTNIRVVHMGVKAGVYVPQAGSVGLNEIDLTAFDNRYYQSGDDITVDTITANGDVTMRRPNPNLYITSDDTGQSDIFFGGASTPAAGNIKYSDNDDSMRFYVNESVNAMWINSAGNIGIGTASPDSPITVMEASNTAINVLKSTGNSLLKVGEDGNGNATYDATLSGSHIFKGTGTEHMRLDASGNLLVGTTDSNLTDNTTGGGVVAQPSGALTSARSAGTPLYLNRTGNSDGTLVDFRKDGGTVGIIGTAYSGNGLTVGLGDCGIRFSDAVNQVIPHNMSTNLQNDGGIDLGRSSARFKDLYLSGGVYLGGTGSANHLDDYEVGVWTPEIYYQNSTDQAAAVNVVQAGRYIKIGGLVMLSFRLDWTAPSSPANDNIGIKNLPFIGADNHYQWAGGATGTTSVNDVHLRAPQANQTLALLLTASGGGNLGDDYGGGSGKYVRGTLTYYTSA